MQNPLGDANFLSAIAAGRGRERDADGISDAFLQQHSECSARGDYAFCSHTSFSQSEVQRIIATRGQGAVDIDQILHAADFRAENDLIGAQAALFGELSRIQRAHDHRFHCDFSGVFRFGEARVLVHHSGEQSLIERAPVHADAHRLLILDGHFDHGAEVGVVFRPIPTLPGLMRYLASARAHSGYFLSSWCPL